MLHGYYAPTATIFILVAHVSGLPAHTVCMLLGIVSADHPTLVCYHSSQTHTATVWALIRPRVSPVIAVIVVTAIAEVNPLCIVMLSCFVFVVNSCLCESYVLPFVPSFVRHTARACRLSVCPLIHDPMFVHRHSVLHNPFNPFEFALNGFNRFTSVLHPFCPRHRIIHVLWQKPRPVFRVICCGHSITYCRFTCRSTLALIYQSARASVNDYLPCSSCHRP